MAVATEDRIVEAFLRLFRERGFEGITTRAVAEEAGVNEVTIFRRFGDKATLAVRAVQRVMPASLLDAHEPRVDVSTPESALAGITRSLLFIRDLLVGHPEVLRLALGEGMRTPAVSAAVAPTPLAAWRFLERTLLQARPQLRAEVDVHAASLALQGLVFMTGLWSLHPDLRLQRREWDRLLQNAVRPLIRGGVAQ
ncbi:MAG: TetR/AcrR family transcriptional regulator [Candidatus Dormibacteraeota bacterium]|nr:TetR/AcrR family transcriptional regulator [Candidatus Dormibacteraeota bacterium]